MKEKEIRPKKIFDEYLRLSEQDVKTFFSACERKDVNCPACGSKGRFEFTKKSFDYQLCEKCLTLYVSPRPEEEAFKRYYTDAPSTRFWAETFYKETEAARRKSIFAPKAQLVMEKIKEFSKETTWLMDIGAGYGTFLEEFSRIASPEFKTVAIEPSDSLSKVCIDKGLMVVKKFMEDIEAKDVPCSIGNTGVFTSFELLEHVYNPFKFLSSCAKKLVKGDMLIFTTLNGCGFDIRLLWENSKSVFPPHHLNFMNPFSIKILLERCGLKTVEVTTPGKLDVDIVSNNIEYLNDRFFTAYFRQASVEDKEKMQVFLSENKLSSHMMIVAVK